MGNNRNDYRKLDMNKLKFSPTPISMEEALSNVIRIEWPEADALLRGEKRIVITAATYPITDRAMGFIAASKMPRQRKVRLRKK